MMTTPEKKILDIHTHIEPAGPNAIFSTDIENFDRRRAGGGQFSLGIHPWKASLDPELWANLETLAADQSVVAIGEAGIDNARSPLAIADQVELLRRHAALSEKLHKPLILHVVGAWSEIMALKREIKPTEPWIVHGFRGKPQLAHDLVRHGLKLSFGEHFNAETLKSVGLDDILAETDESTLGIDKIIENIAAIRGIPPAEMRSIIAANYIRTVARG